MKHLKKQFKMNRICATLLRSVRANGTNNCSMLCRTYQSDISLKSLYPNNKLNIYTPPMREVNSGKFNGVIPLKDLEITYSSSSGPGGQHVNRVNTKVHLSFQVSKALWIPEVTRQKLVQKHKNKINKDGCLVIKSDLTRSQQMNLADALNKLRKLLWELEIEKREPDEDTLEKLRRRHENASKQRLLIKRQRSETKSYRQAPTVDSC